MLDLIATYLAVSDSQDAERLAKDLGQHGLGDLRREAGVEVGAETLEVEAPELDGGRDPFPLECLGVPPVLAFPVMQDHGADQQVVILLDLKKTKQDQSLMWLFHFRLCYAFLCTWYTKV